jgi:hypothetical protein
MEHSYFRVSAVRVWRENRVAAVTVDVRGIWALRLRLWLALRLLSVAGWLVAAETRIVVEGGDDGRSD